MKNKNRLLCYIIARLQEKSTFAGLAAIIIALGYELTPIEMEMMIHYGSILSGVLLIFIKEE